MARLSRRRLLGGLVSAPIASQSAECFSDDDPVVSAVLRWEAERARTAEMLRNWARLEAALQEKTGSLDVGRQARLGVPEARAMRKINRHVLASTRRLDRILTEIANTPSVSPRGALAKIEVGVLELDADYGDEPGWALIRDGAAEMRERL